MGKGAEKDARAAAKTQQTEATARINEDRSREADNLDMWKAALKAKMGQTDFRTPEQQADVTRLASGIASGGDKTMDEAAHNFQLRTGTNSAGIVPALNEAHRETQRGLNQNLVAQKVSDQDKLAQEKMATLTMLGDPAKVYAQNYATSTSGMGSANDLQGKAAQAQNSIWGNVINATGQMGAAAIGLAKPAACWIAEALYGADDPRTHILRYWLNQVWGKTPAGAVVMAMYVRYGQSIAKLVQRWKVVRGVMQPMFDHALAGALEHSGTNILLPRAA